MSDIMIIHGPRMSSLLLLVNFPTCEFLSDQSLVPPVCELMRVLLDVGGIE